MTREEAIERLEFLKGVYSVDTETAIEKIGELEKKVNHQAGEIMRLKQENTDLKVQIYQMIKEKKADDELKAKG